MALQVHQFPCLSDNYGFLIRDEASGLAACIDTPEAAAILRELETLGWKLDLILNTHWHPDHAGGNADVKAATGAMIVGPKEVTRISPLDREVGGGDLVDLGKTRFEVIETGGDTLFALGCGRLFEGTPEQMWTSLQRLAALPNDTKVYCAHEYTASNARFALSVDDGPALKRRAADVFAARERGEWTVPTTIGLEKETNPFLRAPALAGRVGAAGEPDYKAFAAVRAAKDAFRG